MKDISICFLLFKVFFDGFAMCEVVGDGRVDVAETERRKALRDLFGGGAQLEMMNDRIQANPRTLYTKGPRFGDGERNAECLFKGSHNASIIHDAKDSPKSCEGRSASSCSLTLPAMDAITAELVRVSVSDPLEIKAGFRQGFVSSD